MRLGDIALENIHPCTIEFFVKFRTKNKFVFSNKNIIENTLKGGSSIKQIEGENICTNISIFIKRSLLELELELGTWSNSQ